MRNRNIQDRGSDTCHAKIDAIPVEEAPTEEVIDPLDSAVGRDGRAGQDDVTLEEGQQALTYSKQNAIGMVQATDTEELIPEAFDRKRRSRMQLPPPILACMWLSR